MRFVCLVFDEFVGDCVVFLFGCVFGLRICNVVISEC